MTYPRRILGLLLAVALLALLAAPAFGQEDAVPEEAVADVEAVEDEAAASIPVEAWLSIKGVGMGMFDPFPAGEEPELVAIVSLKALKVAPPDAWTLGTTPQKLAADATLDILATEDDIDLGIGIPAEILDADLPIRIGVGRVDAWGWYLKTDLAGQDQDQALSLTATYDRRAGIGAAVMGRWQF